MVPSKSKHTLDLIDLTDDSPPKSKRPRKQFNEASKIVPSKIRPIVIWALSVYPEFLDKLEKLRSSVLDEVTYENQIVLLNIMAIKKDVSEACFKSLEGSGSKGISFADKVLKVVKELNKIKAKKLSPSMGLDNAETVIEEIGVIANQSKCLDETKSNALRAYADILSAIQESAATNNHPDSDYFSRIDTHAYNAWVSIKSDTILSDLGSTAKKILKLLANIEYCSQEFKEGLKEREEYPVHSDESFSSSSSECRPL